MLKIFHRFHEMDYSQLLQLYAEDGPDSYALNTDLYLYLKDDFFRVEGAFYAAWCIDEKYVSVLRVEPYRDGWLVEALQTLRSERGKGFATKLLRSVLDASVIPNGEAVYAHVHKKNISSLAVHRTCGFDRISESAAFIDGSVYQHSCTLKYTK